MEQRTHAAWWVIALSLTLSLPPVEALRSAAPSLPAQEQEDDAPESDDRRTDEFVISFLEGNVQLNPIVSFTSSEAQIYSGLYEGLVGYDPQSLEPEAAVARDWEISEDGLTYTFFIREGARYWNGDAVTAEHFRDTWLKVLSPETDAAYNFLFDVIAGVREYRTGDARSTDQVGITAVDERTLEVRLRRPATHFLRILAHHAFVPVHPSVREREDWSDLQRVPSNGPYMIVERSESELRLERNPEYWAAEDVSIPRMRIIFTAAEDDTEVTERFNRGEIDWVTSGMDLSRVQFTEHIVVNPLFATTYYYMRADVEPFDDERVRRALALLLPWEQIRDPEIQFIPTDTLVPDIPFYPEISGIRERNVDEALALLEDAGYSRGVRLPSLTVHIPQGEESQRVAGLMQDAWEAELEVGVGIEVTPYPDYFDVIDEGEFTVATVSWIGDFADPLTFLQMWISDSNINDAGFRNQRYDRLIDESMEERGEERYDILGQAEEILLETGTVLPISHSPAINLIDRQAIDGWYPNPLDVHPLRYIEFSQRAPAPGVIRFGRSETKRGLER
jgi:peptide/nickel transport system substrate-binding protein/oligopeptide transport system substrate-binding protein